MYFPGPTQISERLVTYVLFPAIANPNHTQVEKPEEVVVSSLQIKVGSRNLPLNFKQERAEFLEIRMFYLTDKMVSKQTRETL